MLIVHTFDERLRGSDETDGFCCEDEQTKHKKETRSDGGKIPTLKALSIEKQPSGSNVAVTLHL